MLKLLYAEFNYSYGLKLSLKKRHLGILNYLFNALTKTKSFYLLMVGSRRHYWYCVKLLSAAVTFFLQIGQDIEMFITKRTPSAHTRCLPVSNKVLVSFMLADWFIEYY